MIKKLIKSKNKRKLIYFNSNKNQTKKQDDIKNNSALQIKNISNEFLETETKEL